MWCVRRWPSPPSRRRRGRGPLRGLLPAHREVGFRGSPALPARCCGCSCSHYLVPTAPTRGPCEKQTPRGLAEEAGERFPRPCHGCCRCPCGLGRPPQQACRERVPRVVPLAAAWRRCPGSSAHPAAAAPGLAPRGFLERK